LPCPYDIASGGFKGGGSTPVGIQSETLLGAALLAPPLRRPQRGDRDYTGGTLNQAQSAVNPAHRISPAGVRGCNPRSAYIRQTLLGAALRLPPLCGVPNMEIGPILREL
ncbi:MAG TPA: hypothetical protein PLM96_03765, partial [Methanoregulaceae archaeon]|nr:hypothetical protein [Methanoregulaceae archaeon]